MTSADTISSYMDIAATEKWKWLSRLLFFITMNARDTYLPDSNDLADPGRMRRFNELTHRVASQLLHFANNTPGVPDEIFIQGLCSELLALGVAETTLRAAGLRPERP